MNSLGALKSNRRMLKELSNAGVCLFLNIDFEKSSGGPLSLATKAVLFSLHR